MSVNFDNIPEELKKHKAWVLWRTIDKGNGKFTKLPLSPHTALAASSTNPGDWGTFEQCRQIFEAYPGECSGIGFVLTRNDPFGFVDLDDQSKCPDPAEARDVQTKVFERFDSYAELSPSGNGLHIIVRTSDVETGAKSSKLGIELYTQERFMTVTGNVYRAGPIEDRGPMFRELWAKIKEGQNSGFEYTGDFEQTRQDSEIIDIAMNAANGAKFRDLHDNNWQSYYASQSEADFAFVNMLAFYSRNHAQTKRIFMNCPLYREETYGHRDAWFDKLIEKAFDRMPPPTDFEGLKLQLKSALEARNTAASEEGSSLAAVAQEPGKALAAPLDNADYLSAVKTFPPGLVGEVAQFIYDQAPRPVREIALVGALGFVAGIAGRGFNVSGTGLNQYLMLVANTGTGKESINSGISKLITAATGTIEDGLSSAELFRGPADIASGNALVRDIIKHPCCIAVLGEFGIRLKTMSQPNASSAERGLKRILLDLYGKSGAGNVLNPIIYSDNTKNTEMVKAPAFSLIGESTPERFFEALDETMISDGLLPRFTIIEYRGPRPEINEEASKVTPARDLIDKVRMLMILCMDMMHKNLPKPVNIEDDALDEFRKFDKYCDSRMNDTNAREATRHIWNRAHLKAMKIAATVAVGVNPQNPWIDLPTCKWALGIVVSDANNMLKRFDEGEVGAGALGQGNAAQIEKIRFTVASWIMRTAKYGAYGVTDKHIDSGVFAHMSISRRLGNDATFTNDRRGSSAALKETVRTMIDCGYFRKLTPADAAARFNFHGEMYSIADIGFFTQEGL